jgi:GAF domain-containing protein
MSQPPNAYHRYPNQEDPFGLAAAYAELQNLLLESDGVTGFLDQLAALSAAVVPASACGITMRRDHEVSTVASSSELARQVDEIQYGHGHGPCLQTLHSGQQVAVNDLATDDRWPNYRPYALAQGIRSSLSLPLAVDGDTIGALNLYGLAVNQFGSEAANRADAFARQATTTLTIVMRQAQQATLEGQLRDALSARAVIDQAIGMIAGLQHCTAADAFYILRETSQRRNIKLAIVAAEIIETISGHPYQPPRPFTERA